MFSLIVLLSTFVYVFTSDMENEFIIFMLYVTVVSRVNMLFLLFHVLRLFSDAVTSSAAYLKHLISNIHQNTVMVAK